MAHRLIWLEIAERHYIDLPPVARDFADELLSRLAVAPTAEPDAVYNEHSDQWSVPLGQHTGSSSIPSSGSPPL